MEHQILRKQQLDFLKTKHTFMGLFTMYKYNPKALEVLERYISVYEQLTQDCYPEIKGMYDDMDGVFKAYAQKRFIVHVPIKWFMRLNIFLPREEIIGKLRNAIEELMSYGIYYYDIHYKNILWNGKTIRLVDMDGAIIDDERYFYHMYYNLVDFILELYFYYRHPLNDYYIPIFSERMRYTEVFSSEFIEYLDVVYECMDRDGMAQIEPFLQELQDKEKVEYAIKNYIQK